ncbi:hypothetical protein XELAEV_18034688mg [Xenopus laevis]|uniref:Uncharacterized protein n=1 Tax=Xenopus laevis TaxID=8355 RepID=A0A974CEE6_XENLA|nr:hypothetical protein XELAEV_18034688mg [Xenopus laevis]
MFTNTGEKYLLRSPKMLPIATNQICAFGSLSCPYIQGSTRPRQSSRYLADMPQSDHSKENTDFVFIGLNPSD